MAYNENLKYPEKNIIEIAYREYNFHIIPPVIGILFADRFGNSIMTFEYDKNSRYGPIKSYLSVNKEKLLEIDLVSMFFSSFSIFASNANIKNLSHLEIHGSNIKIQIYFLFEKFMFIIFLNSNTKVAFKLQEHILEYFNDLIENYGNKLVDFNNEESKKVIKKVRNKGKIWLKNLNRNYIQEFKKGYHMKCNYIDDFIEKIDPIIKNEINEYLQNVPDDIMSDLTREIKYKIQNKVFDLVSELFKK
ncbi:MAG: hypothetical protein ACFFAH_01725 [Promethearchaeota archaeon]